SNNLGTPLSVDSRISQYEGVWGTPRTIRIWSDQQITGATLTLAHNPSGNQSDTGDSDIDYELKWTTSANSAQAVVEMAGHLGVGAGFSSIVPGAWGAGRGSSA